MRIRQLKSITLALCATCWIGCATTAATGGTPLHNQPLYFTSPKQAVEVVIDMIIAEEFEKLSRYYDLSGTDIDRE